MQHQKKYSVLLCTDEPARAAGFQRCFEAHPEFLLLPHVENSSHLIELIASTLPHVLILHSRSQTAKRVLDSVKSMKLDTKVVLWLGDIAPSALDELASFGLAGVLEKQVRPDDLVSLVRKVARAEQTFQRSIERRGFGQERTVGASDRSGWEAQSSMVVCVKFCKIGR